MFEMLENLMIEKRASNLISKVEGRRNWVIHTAMIGNTPQIIFAGGMGEADRRGIFIVSLAEMGEKQYRWYYFTYKKDYLAAKKALIDLGFEEW